MATLIGRGMHSSWSILSVVIIITSIITMHGLYAQYLLIVYGVYWHYDYGMYVFSGQYLLTVLLVVIQPQHAVIHCGK